MLKTAIYTAVSQSEQSQSLQSEEHQQQPAQSHDAANQITEEQPKNFKPWSLFKKLVVAGIKVIVTVEILKFSLERARLGRYLGRRERWGPATDDSVWDSSVDETMGTSSEAAEAIMTYLAESSDPRALRGLSQEQLARGMRKIEAEDIKELGIDEEPEGFLSQLRETAERLKPANQQSKPSAHS